VNVVVTTRIVDSRLARDWWLAIAVAAALGLLLLQQTRATTLWDRDEPRFAQAAVEMLESGQYLLPTFNHELRTQKPALVYWLMTLSIRLFGKTEFAVRCWSPIAMALAALATFAIGLRLWSAHVGLLAMVMLVLNPLAFVEGQAATTDAVLLACITIAAALIVRALDSPPGVTTSLLLGLVLGAGLLTKGPVALMVPIAVAIAAGSVQRRDPYWFRRIAAVACSSIIAVGIYAAWLIPAAAASGGRFVTEGVVRENLLRALVPTDGHGVSWLAGLAYYPLIVVAGFAPWTLYSLAAAGTPSRAGAWSDLPNRILTAWIAVPMIGFTVAATKLPHYVLPVWPALALVSARAAEWELSDRMSSSRFRAAGVALIGTLVCVATAALVVITALAAIDGLRRPAIVLGLLLVAGFGAALCLYMHRRAAAAFALLVIATVVSVEWATVAVLPALDRVKIVPAMAPVIRESAVPVFAYEFVEPSLVFYVGRPVSELVGEQTLVDWARQRGPALLVAPRQSVAAAERNHGALGLREIASRHGWNYSKGQRLEVVAFVRPDGR
jgi:4-amino-4-deoxy-L-arabinose transferase-like glycosyltransferase